MGGRRRSAAVAEWKKVGSPGWTRTSDILINSQALYQLSYRGVSAPNGRATTDFN